MHILKRSGLWLAPFVVATGLYAGETRTYYIAAENVDWEFAPDGMNSMMGMPFDEDDMVFVGAASDRIGSVYKMIRYTGYTDETFTTKLEVTDPSLGLLGPVIHAEVGDEIEVVFKNMSTRPTSVHPHGVFYDKASEGSPTNDGTDLKGDDFVKPGTTYVYHWQVPERAGPGPSDPNSIVWMYHSHVDETEDTNTGLFGPMVITREGMANPDGSPSDVDVETFQIFSVLDQNLNLYIDDMVEALNVTDKDALMEDDDFIESNLMHSINGFVYGSMPMPEMKVGDRVRWYIMALGTEVDLHTPHWHGNTVLMGGHRKDVVELLPATTLVADMVPDNPGIWMYHCHVNDHLEAGMSGRYEVKPQEMAASSK